jgi:hypothetical protein
MALAIVACLIMSVVGGLLPILRRWVKAARRRWPWLDRWIVRARDHKWAPSHLKEFEDLTDPSK